MKKKPADLIALAEKVTAMYKPHYTKHAFRVEMSERARSLECDSARIEQVLNNLISNAAKYSPDGGVISIAGYENGDYYSIEIQDDGIGMTPEQTKRVFEKFYRAPNHSIQGTGLGMNIVKRLVELHDGQISIKSEPGRGTTVIFRLPL